MQQRGSFRPYKVSPAERSDRTSGDRIRHRQKVREAIRGSIADVISEEAIIGKDGTRIVKVPIRGIREFRFVFGKNAPGTASGDGNAQQGQVVGKVKDKSNASPGVAGDQPGQDYYEMDVPLDELIDIMFEDIELSNLEKKKLREVPIETLRKPKGTQHKGIHVRLKRLASAKERIRRLVATKKLSSELEKRIQEMSEKEKELRSLDDVASAEILHKQVEELVSRWQKQQIQASGHYDLRHHPERLSEAEHKEARFPFIKDDLRYRRQKTDTRYESNAVVICMMDTSGSMDMMKKYLARVFFFLLYQFVRSKYKNVEVVFIAHHTEAREVTEEEFFHKGESGGTFISSAYAKALEIIESRYSPTLWNIYAFHCSDGDNFEIDNATSLSLAKKLAGISNLFGYAEVKPNGATHYESSMFRIFKDVGADNFNVVLIEKKEDVWPAFKHLLSSDKAETS